jgi:hypothetical protein
MENFGTKREEKLYRALQKLLHNSVDMFGEPKRATVKQLKSAKQALTDYDNYESAKRLKEKHSETIQ